MVDDNHHMGYHDDDQQVDFGFNKVSLEEKKQKVRNVFENVATKYDIMNDVMSIGLHRYWKDMLVKQINPQKHHHILDLAGGTGDVTMRIVNKASCYVTLLDTTYDMVTIGRDRFINKALNNQHVTWLVGEGEHIPLPSSSFDHCCISFGLRNVSDINLCLSEIYRILKPGGCFHCLEFSKLKQDNLEKLYDFYSFRIIPTIGQIIAKDKDSYVYLAESIRRFPDQEKLTAMIKNAHFDKVTYRNFQSGIVALHYAVKY